MEYVSVVEYLMGRIKLKDLSDEQVANMNTLIPRVNQLLEKFGEKRAVESGFRSKADHERIYNEINAKRKLQNLPPVKIPWKSNHLVAAAIDLEDKDAKLYNFARANEKLLKELGLWCEERMGGWLHMQCIPPKSGRRFFLP